MVDLQAQLHTQIKTIAQKLYGSGAENIAVQFQKTRKDFEGDITLVIFPFVKFSKKSPEATCDEIGSEILKLNSNIATFQVVKGFLNLKITDNYWIHLAKELSKIPNFGLATTSGKSIMLEYSSPNTNKPLHLGHIRNNLLGYAMAEILKANGHSLIKANLINDRGIHICKSMLAWQIYGKGETPESAGIKGDHLVGKYYVIFDKHYKTQINELKEKGLSDEEAQKNAPLILQAQEMLRKWENGDAETLALWQKMNAWVYTGFTETYISLGVDFDAYYYESNTYLLGKKIVEEGLQKNVFYKKEDGSVWCDLTADGLDEKLLLRADGTSVYITQDLGTAIQRFTDYPELQSLIYTVGNEQDYHFKVLFLILGKLGYKWAKECYHLSYGMVDLPSGKMKSREGTVVDADELIAEMKQIAKSITLELGKLEDVPANEQEKLFEMIGLAALKYFILKVDPKKRMLFDPAESIDFNGNTGPFIQYAHARITAIKNRAKELQINNLDLTPATISEKERELIKQISYFPEVIYESGNTFNPSLIANHIYELVKIYNSFYQSSSIFQAESNELIHFRVLLSSITANQIKLGMSLLGIEVPDRM